MASKRSRMMTDETPDVPARVERTETGMPSPRTTIVGGRPPEDDAGLPPVPIGIQSLLRLASVDPAFRDELVRRRADVAEAAGIELTASERAILRAIGDEALTEMASKLPPPPPPRREFLRQTAATAVVLLGGAAMAETLSACCGGVEDILEGEEPITRPQYNEMETEGGISPHLQEELDQIEGDDDDSAGPELPTPRPDTPNATRGIRSDRPERPKHPEAQTTGGAAPDMPKGD